MEGNKPKKEGLSVGIVFQASLQFNKIFDKIRNFNALEILLSLVLDFQNE